MPSDSFPRIETALDTQWRFHLGDTDAALSTDFDDSDWEDVRLPHDWAITCPTDPDMEQGRPQGYQRRGHVGWYRRRLRVQPADGKRYRLRLDGAYRHAEVWIKGHSLGLRPSGYATRIHDITEFLNSDGEQLLAVRCDNTGNDADRWYCGAGLYRRVWLTETGDVAAAPWGVSLTTPEVSEEKALVNIALTVQNTGSAAVSAEVSGQILDAKGDERVRLSAAGVNVPANGKEVVTLQATVKNPELWSPDSPALYRARINIAADGTHTDGIDQVFGIRSISFDVENGFTCNGQSRKMKGVCLHHDLGCLGTAFFRAGWERRLRLLKDLGCNAIRSSHNIPSPELLDLCDRLGFFVIDEAFDKWWGGCSGDTFGDWWQRDIESMVLRDRNHPCVVVWSTGNEVEEQGSERMLKTSRMLADSIKKLDDTRPTLVALRPDSRQESSNAGESARCRSRQPDPAPATRVDQVGLLLRRVRDASGHRRLRGGRGYPPGLRLPGCHRRSARAADAETSRRRLHRRTRRRPLCPLLSTGRPLGCARCRLCLGPTRSALVRGTSFTSPHNLLQKNILHVRKEAPCLCVSAACLLGNFVIQY